MRKRALRSHWHSRFRIDLALLLLLPLAFASFGCATSPTGRSQLLFHSESQMAEMGRAAFEDLKSNTPTSTNSVDIGYVRCIADAITSALTRQDLRTVVVDSWEVEVFDDPSANAFALPGGKIGVHSGLLDVAVSPDQLAAVLGHEVGHVLSRHVNERVTQQMAATGTIGMLQVILGTDTEAKVKLLGALGTGLQYGVLLPFGRAQESEADVIGIALMARAGFDPRESVSLWRNMARAADGPSPPEFLSTHPSHSTRIQRLNGQMPSALVLYNQARAAGRRPDCHK
jgi:predicted Zn-dependent protease